jgi:hypothetical protein
LSTFVAITTSNAAAGALTSSVDANIALLQLLLMLLPSMQSLPLLLSSTTPLP